MKKVLLLLISLILLCGCGENSNSNEKDSVETSTNSSETNVEKAEDIVGLNELMDMLLKTAPDSYTITVNEFMEDNLSIELESLDELYMVSITIKDCDRDVLSVPEMVEDPEDVGNGFYKTDSFETTSWFAFYNKNIKINVTCDDSYIDTFEQFKNTFANFDKCITLDERDVVIAEYNGLIIGEEIKEDNEELAKESENIDVPEIEEIEQSLADEEIIEYTMSGQEFIDYALGLSEDFYLDEPGFGSYYHMDYNFEVGNKCYCRLTLTPFNPEDMNYEMSDYDEENIFGYYKAAGENIWEKYECDADNNSILSGFEIIRGNVKIVVQTENKEKYLIYANEVFDGIVAEFDNFNEIVNYTELEEIYLSDENPNEIQIYEDSVMQ